MSFKSKLVPALVLVFLGPAAESRAQKLDKETKKWLDEVRPIMLPDEERSFRELKEKGDREEFQKIFWARRDPDPATPENEFQAAYAKARAEADTLYKTGGRAGSETDCGRVFLLLGKPDDIRKEASAYDVATFRAPEVWTYRDRPGQTFAGGQAQIAFDANCVLPQGGRLGEQLARIAESKILHPNLGYKKTAEGKLVKLGDQLPKPSATQALLTAPRQDFPLTAESSLTLQTEDRNIYVAGLMRGEATGLTVHDAGGKKTAKVVVAAQALDSAGKVQAAIERPLTVELAADSSFVASFGMALRPGEYTLRVGALDPASGKGSAVTVPFKPPAFGSGDLTIAPLILVQDIQEGKGRDPQDPLDDFTMAPGRLVPRFGNVFTKADSILMLTQIYSPKVDEATGKPSVVSTYTILREGKPIAKAEEQPGVAPSVGPVPLANYAPGKYTVQLKVQDKVAQKEHIQEATFELR